MADPIAALPHPEGWDFLDLVTEDVSEQLDQPIGTVHMSFNGYMRRDDDGRLHLMQIQVFDCAPEASRTAMSAAKPVEAFGDEQVKHMVNRFLMWKLPENFHPDAGISFAPEFNVEYMAKQGLPPQRHNPVGTNLFSADQAEAMVRHMVEGLPDTSDHTLKGD